MSEQLNKGDFVRSHKLLNEACAELMQERDALRAELATTELEVARLQADNTTILQFHKDEHEPHWFAVSKRMQAELTAAQERIKKLRVVLNAAQVLVSGNFIDYEDVYSDLSDAPRKAGEVYP